MNPFTQMAGVLSRPSFPTAPAVRKRREGITRTDSIRELLRDATRSLTAAEISFDLDLPSSCTVWLLMKYDMQKGRVLLADGHYRWNYEYDSQEAEELRDAVKLLKKHGYTVKAPAP
jgi:hypothetical protein